MSVPRQQMQALQATIAHAMDVIVTPQYVFNAPDLLQALPAAPLGPLRRPLHVQCQAQ